MIYSKENITGIEFDYNDNHYKIGEVIDDSWVWMSSNISGYGRYKATISAVITGLNSKNYQNIKEPDLTPQIKDNYELY